MDTIYTISTHSFLLKTHKYLLVKFDPAEMPCVRTGLVTEVLLHPYGIKPTQNYTFYVQFSVIATLKWKL